MGHEPFHISATNPWSICAWIKGMKRFHTIDLQIPLECASDLIASSCCCRACKVYALIIDAVCHCRARTISTKSKRTRLGNNSLTLWCRGVKVSLGVYVRTLAIKKIPHGHTLHRICRTIAYVLRRSPWENCVLPMLSDEAKSDASTAFVKPRLTKTMTRTATDGFGIHMSS